MNKYEALYIIDKDVTDEGKQAVLATPSEAVTARGGEMLNVDQGGKSKYADPITSNNAVYAVLMNFNAPDSVPAEVDRLVRIMDETVRIMTVRK